MVRSSALSAALDAWREILGVESVVEDPGLLGEAATATFATRQRIPAIIRVSNRDQVQRCLEVASRRGVPVYPISRGRNWGLGSRVPVSDGCVVMELGRMDRIVDFDEELAYLTVEPGVTFRRAYEFLRARGSRLFLNTTGASPEASLVGNAVERGEGAGPYGDRFAHVCGLEVVLATGECIHTGFGRFGESGLARLHRWGVGPALDGLFSQSNLGVVTRMTVWLSRLPRSLHVFRFSIRKRERLPALIESLRRLLQDGTIRSGVGLWNDFRVLSAEMRCPWPHPSSGADAASRIAEAEQRAGAAWFGLAATYAATAEQGEAHRIHVESTLCPVVDELSIESRAGDPRSGEELFAETDPGLMFIQGMPHEASLRSLYWRKASAPEHPDPDRDRVGVIWACATVPIAGAPVAEAVRVSEELMPARGFEPLLALVTQSERCVHLVSLIVYDREMAGEDERARACHDELLARLCSLGYLPFRLGIHSMGSLPDPVDDYGRVLQRLKRALDPSDVLSPGRYDFRGTWKASS
jgi:4-cresol dehydrogenase (hydroxylating)